jgi:hypothetical protein
MDARCLAATYDVAMPCRRITGKHKTVTEHVDSAGHQLNELMLGRQAGRDVNVPKYQRQILDLDRRGRTLQPEDKGHQAAF